MNFETVVSDVKDQLETVGERAQKAAEASYKTLKQANEVVIDGFQGLVKTQTDAAKDLIEAGKQSFEKAKTAGLVAVASNPIEYLPDGRDTLVGAFQDSVDVITKTGEELAKVVKTGYETVAARIQGKPLVKKAGAKRKAPHKAKRAAEPAEAAAV